MKWRSGGSERATWCEILDGSQPSPSVKKCSDDWPLAMEELLDDWTVVMVWNVGRPRRMAAESDRRGGKIYHVSHHVSCVMCLAPIWCFFTLTAD